MKDCKDCGLTLPLSMFSARKSQTSSKNYPNPYCMKCAAVRTKAWREANQERVKLTKQLYEMKNREKVNEAKRDYRRRKRQRKEQS